MNRILAATLLCTLTALPALGEEEARTTMTRRVDRALSAIDATRQALTRTEVAPGVAHYRLDIQVGAGTYDVIRLHRIVRERAPWWPRPTYHAIMLTHGDAWAFEANFTSGAANMATFLAENGVDVWGIDFRWALVPAETADLSFMGAWDFGTSVADLDLALATARSLRAVTGSGFGQLSLLGFSRGGQIGWAQLGAETQRPTWHRHVRGFVAMEHAFKTDDEALRLSSCADYDAILTQINDGTVFTSSEVLIEIGELAINAPNDPSPFFPSLDNTDLAEVVGALPGGGSIPHFHAVGGVVDPATFETELLYTQPARWFGYLTEVAPFQPLGINLEGAAIVCDELDVPYDDHFAAIAVPVLYVGVDGAFGALGIHQTSLIASADVSTLIIDQAADPALDYGHNEVVLADDAETLVWQPILDWIEDH